MYFICNWCPQYIVAKGLEWGYHEDAPTHSNYTYEVPARHAGLVSKFRGKRVFQGKVCEHDANFRNAEYQL